MLENCTVNRENNQSYIERVIHVKTHVNTHVPSFSGRFGKKGNLKRAWLSHSYLRYDPSTTCSRNSWNIRLLPLISSSKFWDFPATTMYLNNHSCNGIFQNTLESWNSNAYYKRFSCLWILYLHLLMCCDDKVHGY